MIEACEYDRLHAVLAHEFERITTHVRLAGEGTDGLGEDVSIFREDGTALHETRPCWFEGVDAGRLLRPPRHARAVAAGGGALRFRNWAFESARSTSRSRPARSHVLGLEPQPVRFATRSASARSLRSRLAPAARPSPACASSSTRGDVGPRSRRGRGDRRVDTIDFKGQYGFEVKDRRRCAVRPVSPLPGPYLETTTCRNRAAARITSSACPTTRYPQRRGHRRDAAAARIVNVKPSRIGSLRRLFEVYARCARERRPMYGGGMGELGGPRADRAPRRFVPRRCAQRRGAERYNEATRRRPAGQPLAPPPRPRLRWAA